MKSRTCYASQVVCDDAFLALSLEAQLAYFYLLCECDGTGRVCGISRILRGYGFESDTLDELVSEGYILDVDGDHFITHHWMHNRFDSRVWAQMDSCQPYLDGTLAFAGKEGKSAYVLAERRDSDGEAAEERRDSDGEAAARARGSEPKVKESYCEPNVNVSNSEPKRKVIASYPEMSLSEEKSGPCLCTKCHEEARYRVSGGTCYIECRRCGTYAAQDNSKNRLFG